MKNAISAFRLSLFFFISIRKQHMELSLLMPPMQNTTEVVRSGWSPIDIQADASKHGFLLMKYLHGKNNFKTF